MRLAVTTWDGRISPVFDTARELLVADVEGQQVLARQRESLGSFGPWQRVNRVRELEVNTLICGAISRPLAEMLSAAGIAVIPFVAGDAEEVVAAYLHGDPLSASFAMPGCRCGQGPGVRGRHGNRGSRPRCARRDC